MAEVERAGEGSILASDRKVRLDLGASDTREDISLREPYMTLSREVTTYPGHETKLSLVGGGGTRNLKKECLKTLGSGLLNFSSATVPNYEVQESSVGMASLPPNAFLSNLLPLLLSFPPCGELTP